jgi:crotonobetainyl-CoA hydratase
MSLHVESEDGVLLVAIDRPKANAIDAETSREMGRVFRRFEDDPALRVAIVTGTGPRFFSAGWDLGAANDGESFEADFGVGGFGGFPELPGRTKPVIAAVNGMAVGGGFEIVMAADFVVAADHATFFLPECGLGLLPDAGTVRLPRLLPPVVANEVILAGRRLAADEMLGYGAVNSVVPAGALLEEARSLAARICASAPLSVAAVLDLQRATSHLPVAEAMAALRANAAYKAAISSADAAEGPAAFAEKRPPRWQGR